MSSARHRNQTLDQGIHAIVAYYFNNEADRLAASGFLNYDLYKLAIQLSDQTFWIITDVAVNGIPTWQNIGNSTGSAVGGDLSGTLPNPSVVDLSISGQSQGAVLYYNGTNWVVLSPGTDGYVLTTHSTGQNPTWSLASGSGSGLANTLPLDVTKFSASVGTSVLAARADHKHDIAVGTPVSIGPTNSAGSSTSLARADHTHAVVDLDIAGQAQGSILYFNGTNWVVLAAGQDGYVLTAKGTAANPIWNLPASGGGGSGPALAAGTQTASSGTVSFINSNGISFGMSNSNQITASYTVPSTAGLISGINLSAGTTSNNLSAVTFSNSNGLSFGLNGSVITGSYTVPSTAGLITGINVSGGTTSNNLSAIVFSNSNNLTFGLSGSTITGSISVPSQTSLSFSNLNGISFGIAGSTLTASYTVPTQTNQTEGRYAVGNTVGQSSSSTFDARTMSISGAGVASVGYSAGNLIISVPAGIANVNVSAGTTSNNLTNFVFSNSNNVSFGLNGSTITATVTTPVQTNQTEGRYAIGNTTGQSSSSTFDARTLSISGAGNISVGYSGNALVISGSQSNQTQNVVAPSAGTQTATSGTVVFSNSNGISFGMSNSSVITASYTVPSTAGLITGINFSAGTTSNNLTAFTLSNSNGLSFGLNGSIVTGSYTVPIQTNQSIGLYGLGNTTQNSSTTLDARSLSFNGLGAASVGYSNGSIQISVPNTVDQTAYQFSNSNGISFGTAGSTVTASYTVPTIPGATVFSNSNNVSFGLAGSTITATATFAQTNQSVGLYALGNTTQNSSTTLDARSLSFNGLGAASVGYSNGSIQVSVPVQSVQTQSNIQGIYDGVNSITTGTIRYSNANGVSFGINGQTLTGSVANQTNQTVGLYALGNTTQNSSTTLDARSLSFNGLGIASVGYSNGSIQISVPSGLTNINVSAGTTSNNLTAITFSNSNGLSFGLNGSTITGSYTVPTQTAQTVGLYALGNTTQNSSTTLDARTLSFNGLGIITAGYSNGSIQISAIQTNQTEGSYAVGNTVGQSSSSTFDARTMSISGAGIASVGYSAGNLIISVPSAGALVNFSAGTTSSNLGAVTFSNSNGVSFGLSNGVITATVTPGAAAGIAAIQGGTQTATSGTVSFANSNGISFGLSNSSVMTASYTVPVQTNQSIGLYGLGNTTQNSSTTLDARSLSFNGLGGATVGYSNGSIQISAPTTAGLISAINVSAGTTSNNLVALTFSNSNGLSFGLNGSTITGSYTVPTQTAQTVGLYALGNTTQNSSTTLDARSISFNGLGAASVGYSNGSVQISVPNALTNINISAGTTSNNLTAFTFNNANGISFGLNASVITASYTVPTQTNQTEGMYAIGNTAGQSSSSTFDARTMSVSGAGNISVGYSGNALLISGSQSAQTQNIVVPSAGTQSATSGTVIFSNSNGISFGMSNSSVITASYTVPSIAGLITGINLSAGTTSNNLTAFTFSNSNGLSFGLNGSTITGSYTVPVQTNQSIGLYALGNTTQNSSTTLDARSLSFNGLGAATVGYSNGSVQISVPVQSVQTNNIQAFYDGANSISTGTIRFTNANGVSFSINGQTISGSVAAQTNQTIGLYALGNTTQNSSTTLDARSLSFNGLGIITAGYSNGSVQISAIQSVQTANIVVPSAGTQTATSGTVVFSNSNGISFGMSNSSVITASYTVPSTAGLITGINVSAGTTSNNLTNFVFSNSNNVSFGLNGSTITGSIPVQTNQTLGLYAIGNTAGQSSSSTFDARTLSVSGLGGVSVGYSGNNLIISSPVIKASQLIWPENPWQTNFGISNASLSLQHFNAKENITATQANLLLALAGDTNSSGALTISLGIYTMAGSTMSLASSDSRQITWTSGGATNSSSVFGGVSGTRYRTVGLGNWSISAGDYMLGMWFRTTNNGTWRAFGQQGPIIVGAQDVNETQAYLHGFSASSYTTAMVASVNVTNTNYVRTGGDALQQPGIVFLGTY